MDKIEIIKDPTKGDRWIIVSKETGEIIDDANGYGFKTDIDAYKCYCHKETTNIDYKEEKIELIKNWLNGHKDFTKALETLSWDCSQNGEEFNENSVKYLLNKMDIHTNQITSKEIFKVWTKYAS